MTITNEELAALIRDVAAKIEKGGLDSVATLALPLRAHAYAKCHERLGHQMNNTEEGFRLQLEWFAGQLLEIVDRHKWFAMNSWLNCVKRFTTPAP